MAIVIVGLIVAAGGTIAAVSIRSSGEKPEATKNETVATTTEGAYSGPVLSQVESSEENKRIVTPKSVSTDIEANTKPANSIRAETREICTKAQSDLADVKANGDGTGDLSHTRKSASLLRTVAELCNTLEKDLANGHSDTESTREKEQAIKEKWQLWQTASAQGRQREFEIRAQERQEQSQVVVDQTPEVPQPEPERYTESSTYPIIVSFTDNYGNLYKGSDYNGYQGPYASKKKAALRVGDTIKATVEAKDPKGRALEYNWNASSQHFNDAVGRGQYTTSNTLSYTLTYEDLQSAGETFRLVYQVRVAGTSFYRFGGGQYDDVGFIDYQLSE